jgi:hypothetical protein
MLGAVVLQIVLSTGTTLLGSIGVFFLAMSTVHPAVSPHALFFLTAASGIVLYAPR